MICLRKPRNRRWLPPTLLDDHSLMAVPRAPVHAGDVAGVIALCENRAAYVIFVELAEAGDAKHAADVADEQSGAGLYRACHARQGDFDEARRIWLSGFGATGSLSCRSPPIRITTKSPSRCCYRGFSPADEQSSRPIESAVSSIAATELNRGAVSNSLDILIQAYDCLAVHLTGRTDCPSISCIQRRASMTKVVTWGGMSRRRSMRSSW